MRAHIVGGGFGGLAAAALLILNAGMSGEEITIYEVDERLCGGFFLGGSAESGYNLPGSVFDKEYRCTFELLKSIPSTSNSSVSVTDEFFAFNMGEPYDDKASSLIWSFRYCQTISHGKTRSDFPVAAWRAAAKSTG
jgi:oleate hydratase